jgi:twitching motility protein PilT
MRDQEVIDWRSAAGTGHLVGTLQFGAWTIERIIGVFPRRKMVSAMLSESLVSVVAQTLLKTKDGQGRVTA